MLTSFDALTSLTTQPFPKVAEAIKGVPFLIGHGDADPLIPHILGTTTTNMLKERGEVAASPHPLK